MSRIVPLLAFAAAVGGVSLLGYMMSSTPTKSVAQPAPPSTQAGPRYAEQIGEQLRKQREAEEQARSAEFAKDRAKILASIRSLIAANQWDKAEAKARDYIHVGDAELARLEEQASAGAMARRERDAKVAARKQGVSIGMTPDQVRASSWGRPREVNRTTTARGTREQWVYSSGNYLYFDNGVLTAIQN